MSATAESSPLRRSILFCLVVVSAYVLVGAIAGVVWEWVWSPPHQVVQDHQLYYTDYSSLRRVFDGTGLYALVGAIASAVTALVAALLTRRHELLVLLAVLVGSLLAGYTMHAVGTSLGPADATGLAKVAATGTRVSGQLQVQGKSAYLVWPMVSLIVLSLVFFASPGRGRQRAAATEAASSEAQHAADAAADQPSEGPVHRQQLVDQITSVRFTPVRIHEGYEMGAVDRLLDDLGAAVSRGEAPAPVLDRELPKVRVREGYDIAQVTAFLDRVRTSAEGLESHT